MIFDLGANAIVSGVLLGGLYAVASLGLTITFGLLQIPNVAHPTFMVLGAYCAYLGNLSGRRSGHCRASYSRRDSIWSA